ncbi:Asp-tRNA(Asn)/Glu-tRNA(Gln) amidotransferase subunit GatC [Patescibacteria group bacterium]|nr:Asp-tRNA(Asn)/Glu-tRNA(Gln) amidotransferase subunit GatC [Patescibacteria group bacterium]
MIKKEDVRHIAKLARLGISISEEVGLQKDLSSVLDYVNLLNKVDVSDVEPTYHPMAKFFKKNIIREDIGEDQQIADDLIKLMPQIEERHTKVKSILN